MKRFRVLESVGRGPVKTIAIASGTGGAGKTQIAVNLAVALARGGKSTMLMDANLGLASVDTTLGLKPEKTLADVIKGDVALDEILLQGPSGLKVIPASLGETGSSDMGRLEQMGLINAFSSMRDRPDYMIVDTAPGVGSTALGFCAAADVVLIVLHDDPCSLTHGCALATILAQERGVHQFGVICNRVQDLSHGVRLFKTFVARCEECFDFDLRHSASIPADEGLSANAGSGRVLLQTDAASPAAVALRALARSAETWPSLGAGSGRPIFFAGCEFEGRYAAPVIEVS